MTKIDYDRYYYSNYGRGWEESKLPPANAIFGEEHFFSGANFGNGRGPNGPDAILQDVLGDYGRPLII